MNRTDAAILPGVTFEVERFEWTADDRLALMGRWFGLRGHRFLRPTLDVDVSGERRRMLADLEHKPWAAEEGQEWIAEFRWRGEPAHFRDAELTVSPDLAVQLPQPDNSIAEPDAPVRGERLPARPPRTAVLEAELAAAADELRRVTNELTNLRDQHTDAAQTAAAELDEARKERDEAAAAHAKALGEMQRERDEAAALHAEALDQMQSERDEARERLAAVQQERDEARARIAAVEADVQAAAEARDEARAERNAWMSRAHAAELPPAPAPEAEPPAPPADARDAEPRQPAASPAADASPREPHAVARRAIGGRSSGVTEEADSRPPRDDATLVDAPVARSDPPRRERRTIRIGERPVPAAPGPMHDPFHQGAWRRFLDRWGARLAALAALIVILAVIALVLAWVL